MVNVTIVSRKDTISNWQTSNPVLSDGEVAVVEIPATDSTPAICLIKIGDGTTPFNTLQYMQSPAADVYAWAKASTKPEYDYSEIKNLTTMIVAGNNITATTKDNRVTIATPQNVAKIPGTLPDIGDIEALPVWNSDEGWKRIDMDALKATANTIVKRNASGQIVTAAPTANGHATNKQYVDGLVNDNKIARLTDTSKQYVMPCWRGTEWTQYPLTEASIASYSIVQRTSQGQVRVGTPTEDNMATPKSYVDNKATAENIKWDTVTSSTAGSITPIGMVMSDFHSANRLAFGKATGITIESSTDGGTTWVDSAIPDSEKTGLVSGIDGYRPTIGLVYPVNYSTAGRTATANDMLRITLDGNAMGVYTHSRKLLINVSTAGATGSKVLVERARNSASTDFQTVIEAPISGWSGWNDITFGDSAFNFGSAQSANWGIIRLTFSITGVSSETYSGFLQILNLALFGDTYWATPSSYAKSGHLYTWDYDQNVTFPKQVRTYSVPAAENDLTNKKYVDGLVAGKQSKLTAGNGIDITDNAIKVTDNVPYLANPTTTGTQAVVRESGKWSAINVSSSLGAYTIARRGAAGVLEVGTPTADGHAATKAYVDSAVAAISTGGGSSKKLLRFDGNTPIYFDHTLTSAYQYTFHLHGETAMDTGSIEITVGGSSSGGSTVFSLTPGSDALDVDGTLMFYPVETATGSGTVHNITYSYTASDGTCKSGYIRNITETRVWFTGAIGAPANGIYCNWVIQEQMSCEIR